MMRRASIPAARPRPARRRPRAEQRDDVVERAPLPRPGEPRPRPPPAQPFEAVVLGADPHRRLRRHEGREHRHQRHLVDPVLIERLDPAQVVEPARREPGLLLHLPRAPPRPGARRPRCGRAPFPTTRDSGLPRRGGAPGIRGAAPAPRSTYTSTSDTRTEVTAATGRTRRAARSRPAATSRGGTARR